MHEVTLRTEQRGNGSRHLWAYVDDEGRLHIAGQDLGEGTEFISGDGEYEWDRSFSVQDVPRVLELLDGEPGEDALLVLQRWAGRSYELEERLRDSAIPSKLWTYGG